MLGEIMTIFLEEKLLNVRLTFHRRRCITLFSVRCGCDATASLNGPSTVIGKQKNKPMAFVILVSQGEMITEGAPLNYKVIPFTGLCFFQVS